ncbi:cation transporter [Thermosipho melanesiensis]|uniref:Cation diffusion facilitator family transporter n=2 Tax=Thermosipho melanesiensis TaxID=46541 RepID=A6LME7_THEM4|nr:cation diffusion facilitator family transporter [Thermosipho melanesiensis]ABR31098.1 cation diffusion facilitator family transporter [Thermosipho melanesiensis BI429]APT74193.1 cation transporter [Thermosipho melanesiensis]OOC36136.1 cation transporter [Thermosipho melanesiensis]OOC36953.1 cation transporter [Thermosipho melanesiensis]OOC37705.1 cation transporter [Thermosipho melanesiensis]
MHSHEHHHDVVERKLIFSVIFNFLITASEIIGGIVSGSLALISDALHNLSDTGALLISYFARKISKKPVDNKYTYGYKRAELVASVINITVLLSISFSLILEGIKKILSPVQINTSIMLIVAYVGLVGNLLTAILLSSHSKENLNLKSAFLHILSDMFSSVGIIITGHVMSYYNIWILDPIITFVISGYIIIESIKILKESIRVVMQGIPKGVDLDKVKKIIQNFSFVKDVHHIHVWSLDGIELYLEMHVTVDGKDYDDYLRRIKETLKEHGFRHSTIQLEQINCGENCIAEIQ